jgi:hypothetical protein
MFGVPMTVHRLLSELQSVLQQIEALPPAARTLVQLPTGVLMQAKQDPHRQSALLHCLPMKACRFRRY